MNYHLQVRDEDVDKVLLLNYLSNVGMVEVEVEVEVEAQFQKWNFPLKKMWAEKEMQLELKHM